MHLFCLNKNSTLNVRSITIEVCEVALGVHLVIPIGLSLANGVNAPEVSWAPHLVGIQLVWALELVAALLLSALKEYVTRLEA